MSAPAALAVVTRGQVLDVLDRVPYRTGEPWVSVLWRARFLAEQLAGLDVALAAVEELHTPGPDRELSPDLVPIAWTPNGRPRSGIAYAVSEAERLLRARWHQVLYRYGWLAQAAVDVIASGDAAPRVARVGGPPLLPGEPTALDSDLIEPPTCALPDGLRDDPAWAGVRNALGRLHTAQAAATDYNELVFVEDPDTGETVVYLPEHMIGTAADLEAAADDWPHGVAEYADAVVHLLATHSELLPSAGGAR